MTQKQQVLQWLDDHRTDLQELLSQWIRIPSFSGEEYNMQMAVKEAAEAAGFPVQTRAFDEEQRRPCVLATYRGTGGGKRLMLDAHSDTVPIHPDQKWDKDPLSGEFDGTWIYGRGSCDDKWGIAAAFMALRALKECGVTLSGDVQLLSSVGEEVNRASRLNYGAGAMVASMEEKPDFCIVCEESAMQIGIETPGNLRFDLRVQGKPVHTCVRRNCIYPQPSGVYSGNGVGVDALQKAMLVIDALYRLERDLSTNYNRGGLIGSGGLEYGKHQSVGAVSINPTKIEGGGANSLIPCVTVRYSMHYAPSYTKEELMEHLRKAVQGVAMTDLWLRENPPELEFLASNPGFSTDPNHPAVKIMQRACEEATGKPGITAGWLAGCDGDVMGIPCAVFGPTGIGAHAGNERMKLDGILDGAKTFAMMAMEYCK